MTRQAQILLGCLGATLTGLGLTQLAGLRRGAAQLQSKGAEPQGQVISAPSGDRLVVQSGQRTLTLRLCGIDAPDPPQPNQRSAQAALQKLVGQSVQYLLVRQQADYSIAEVFAEDQALGPMLVVEGLAYLYPNYLAECPNQQALVQAEREAKQQHRGIWASPQTSPQLKPWDYRREFAAKQLNQAYQQWVQQPKQVAARLPQIDPDYLRDGMQTTSLGFASWYGPVLNGRTTANGEKFDQRALTVAHASLPFDSRLKVTNLNNGKSVTVRVNDRHPIQTVGFDLSKAAAQAIDSIQAGVVPVEVEILPPLPVSRSLDGSMDR